MHRGVVDKYAALLHHFLDVAQTQRVGHVPAHAREHHFKRIVEPNEHLAQSAVDRTYTEIKHGLDGRLRLLQQNPLLSSLAFGALRGAWFAATLADIGFALAR